KKTPPKTKDWLIETLVYRDNLEAPGFNLFYQRTRIGQADPDGDVETVAPHFQAYQTDDIGICCFDDPGNLGQNAHPVGGLNHNPASGLLQTEQAHHRMHHVGLGHNTHELAVVNDQKTADLFLTH